MTESALSNDQLPLHRTTLLLASWESHTLSMSADRIQGYISQADKELSKYKPLVDLERQTGFPKVYLVGGVAFLYFLLIFLNYGGELLSNMIGFGVPAYFSLQALESITPLDDKQWLTYWVVFGFFSVVEYWSKTILYWLPFYWLFKTVFVLWLSLPQFQGAQVVYRSVVHPLAAKYLGVGSSSASANLRAKVDAATEHPHAS
jgi:receptor expression-enhancing protein 5/6